MDVQAKGLLKALRQLGRQGRGPRAHGAQPRDVGTVQRHRSQGGQHRGHPRHEGAAVVLDQPPIVLHHLAVAKQTGGGNNDVHAHRQRAQSAG